MKKTFLTMLTALLALSATAQHKYHITGTAPEGATQVYVVDMTSRNAKADTLQVVNGKFSVSGEVDQVKFANVLANVKPENAMPVLLQGEIKVNLQKKTLDGNAENKGLAQWWAKMDKYNEQVMLLSTKMNELNKQYEAKGQKMPDSVAAPFYADYEKIMGGMAEVAVQSVKENPNSLFPALLLRYSNLSNEQWIKVADMSPKCLDVPMIGRIKTLVEGWRRQAVGSKFTDLEMPDTTGTMRKLSDFVGKGKYVLVDFWASWCGPCRREMPEVKALYDKYHSKGFDVVGVSFDNKHEAWVKSIKQLDLPWHHISDLKGWGCAASSVYGINSIPATLLIGPDGKIVAAGLRADGLKQKLAEIFPEK